MAAALAGQECGLHVTVIDEQAKPGGQILRQPPKQFTVTGWLEDRVYREAKTLLNQASEKSAIIWQFHSAVSAIVSPGVHDNFTLIIAGQNGIRELLAKRVLITPGCFDMPVLFPGCNLPGVMASGGIQAFVKCQQLVPGERFLFVGSHPLQLIVADQIVKAGGKVAGVIFAQSRSRMLALLKSPFTVLRNFDKFAQVGAAIGRLYKAGVPITFNQTIVRANGEDILQSATVAPIANDGLIQKTSTSDIKCDRLGICFGFLAATELAWQAGVECIWDAKRGGWITIHDEWMRSTVPGISVAGEITAIAGADVAALEGQIAAYGCASSLGSVSLQQVEKLSVLPRLKVKRLRRFARILTELSWPGASLLDQLESDSVNLCKCEEVTIGSFFRMMQLNPHITTANSAKLLSRAGMGLCQGRYCQYSVTRLMARQLGVSENKIGAFTSRFPAKAIAIHDLLKCE